MNNTSTGSAHILCQNSSTGDGVADGYYVGLDGTIGYLWNYESSPLIFGTSGAEKMRLLSTGGITFNADTAQANALDDYEEGTFPARV